MAEPRPHCFHQGRYVENLSVAVVEFSDGSVYEYRRLLPTEWLAWRDADCRGCVFNTAVRPGPFPFRRLPAWPSFLTPEFEDPLGVGG